MKSNIEIEQQVFDFIRALPPVPRLAMRRALKKLAAGQGDVRALQEELNGFHRLRVLSYRDRRRWKGRQPGDKWIEALE